MKIEGFEETPEKQQVSLMIDGINQLPASRPKPIFTKRTLLVIVTIIPFGDDFPYIYHDSRLRENRVRS